MGHVSHTRLPFYEHMLIYGECSGFSLFMYAPHKGVRYIALCYPVLIALVIMVSSSPLIVRHVLMLVTGHRQPLLPRRRRRVLRHRRRLQAQHLPVVPPTAGGVGILAVSVRAEVLVVRSTLIHHPTHAEPRNRSTKPSSTKR